MGSCSELSPCAVFRLLLVGGLLVCGVLLFSVAARANETQDGALPPAQWAEALTLTDHGAVVKTDGQVVDCRSFVLTAPPRLVVDLYGVKPRFAQQSFVASGPFRQVRLGLYDDKTRFVFDPADGVLPEYVVECRDNSVVVNWDVDPPQESPAPPASPGDVTVEKVDFSLEGTQSVLTVTLSAPGALIAAEAKGEIVHFGIDQAVLPRALRRVIDTSGFPSAVRQITPYTVREGQAQQVRFAAELKGSVPFSARLDGKVLRFSVENGAFAEAAPPAHEVRTVPVAAAPPAVAPKVATKPTRPAVQAPAAVVSAPEGQAEVAAASVPSSVAPAVTQGKARSYSGQKISLVFDEAEIRKILQLIGEVSDLNIIAGDDIKGTITLRLIDVPWDQALDLIMEIKGLGMLREGNVARILPQERIRTLQQAQLDAAKTREKLEDLVTEVVSVSYTDLGNVAGPSRELLSERGKITEDARNKKLIVKDIAAVVAEIRQLVRLLDTPEKQVMIEARIVEADSSFSRELGVKWGFSFADDSGGAWDPSSVNAGLGGSLLITPPTAGSVGTGAGFGTGITFGRLGIDSTILDLRISALETSGHGRIVSTPRVSTLNGGEAKISQGTTIPYQSSGSNGELKTEFVEANLELNVKPVINPDNSVILDITASNSSPGSTVSTGTGTAPSIDTKEAKTKVLVRDGETTVIGGIFVENEDYSVVGVPLLMHIPFLGHLFKTTEKTTSRSELLVFITPHIVL